MMLELRQYQTVDRKVPHREWFDGLRDRKTAAKVAARIDRLVQGNFGDYRALDGGVYELRVDWGPGYRVYFGRVGKVILLLLCGGDKTTQDRDIRRAKAYLQDYEKRAAQGGSAKRSV